MIPSGRQPDKIIRQSAVLQKTFLRIPSIYFGSKLTIFAYLSNFVP